MRESLTRLLSHLWPPDCKDDTRCACCGTCCESFGGHLTTSRNDLKRWRKEGRDDLLRLVNRLGWIWVDPDTGHLIDPCPFLRRLNAETAFCDIHETKPDICRAYPTLAHGRRCPKSVYVQEGVPSTA